MIDETAEVARLWESFPTLSGHGFVNSRDIAFDPDVINAHMQKIALHFFRGGAAAIPQFRKLR